MPGAHVALGFTVGVQVVVVPLEAQADVVCILVTEQVRGVVWLAAVAEGVEVESVVVEVVNVESGDVDVDVGVEVVWAVVVSEVVDSSVVVVASAVEGAVVESCVVVVGSSLVVFSSFVVVASAVLFPPLVFSSVVVSVLSLSSSCRLFRSSCLHCPRILHSFKNQDTLTSASASSHPFATKHS